MNLPFYWQNSKFANWIIGSTKPLFATSVEWDEWHATTKEAHPYRYWFVEELLPKIQSVLNWPLLRTHDVKYHIINRFVTHTHTLTSHSLSKGQWNDLDTRMLHCMFDELVNFVEVSEGGQRLSWDEDYLKQYRPHISYIGPWGFRQMRCPQAGIDLVKWAANLKHDESNGVNTTDSNYGKPTKQALAAHETLILYHWWKVIRPARPSSMDASGINTFLNQFGYTFKMHLPLTKAQVKTRSALYELMNKIDTEYEVEDTEMLIRLVKHRHTLWN